MHALATSYQPVARDEEQDGDVSANGAPKPSVGSRLARFMPSVRLDGETKSWHTFTQMVFGWPMPPHDPARETAWLDGLRGTAAFLVMAYHFNLNWMMPALVEEPWGANMAEHGWDLWRMPFLRIFMCSGHTQVSIFFVLSGFVLSWSSLGSIRAANYDKLYKGLGSSAFRRWIRLYLPTVPIAFWECLELYFGYREIGSKERQPNFLLQLWDFFKSCEQYANPFAINRSNWDSLHPYDWTMWTIPYEFSGSLLVFMILLGVGRIQNYGRRTIAIGAIVAYSACRAEWSFWLFSNGILIADYVREHGGFKGLSEKQTPLSLTLWSGLLAFALWLGGVPTPFPSMYTRPGYDWMDAFIPTAWMDVEGGGRFWWNIAGILIVFAACHLSGVRRIFELGALRYLGRISYMMYLTHRVVLEPALRPYRDWVLVLYGRDGFIDLPADNGSPWHWFITIAAWCTLWAVIGPSAIFTAHWCTTLFDEPSVKFARWVDDKFMKGVTKRVDAREEQAPTLPTHAAAPASRRQQETGVIPAPYRDEDPSAAATSAPESKESKEDELELKELPARPDEIDGNPQSRSLV